MDAATRLVGLIGWPVSHSVSPAMHNAAFAALGLNWAYLPLAVPVAPQERIAEAVRGLRALGFAGANVTIPHKQSVLPHLDVLSAAAQAIGAVNTIVVQDDGTLLGDNTDAAGFAADLRDRGVTVRGQSTAVVGAGGSARAVVYALAADGAARVLLLNRSPERAQRLAAELAPLFPDCVLEPLAFPAGVEAAAGAGVIVNCTSLGMRPHEEGIAWQDAVPFRTGQVVYDLVYSPMHTRLLKKAEADGAHAIGGLGMLVWQGALAFERWTGRPAPVQILREAAQARFAASV